MADSISAELFMKNSDALLGEAFNDVKGIFLDKGTSLEETLAEISAEEASRTTVDGGTTIAGHTSHIRFYIDILGRYMDGTLKEKVDWSQSWLVREVSEFDWNTLRQGIANGYKDIKKRFDAISDWDDKAIGGVLGVITHTAFHLGAIRQMIKVVKK